MANEHEKDAAKASDVEQRTSHGGNSRDSGAGAEGQPPGLSNAVGSSGRIPGREEALPPEADDATGSPGADADRGAASP